MLNFLNNLANLIFGSVWALFLICLGLVVFFIGGSFIWSTFDLSNTWWYFVLIFLGMGIFIAIKKRIDDKDKAILNKIEEQRKLRRLGYKTENKTE